jgi:glycosyltransferase involved in cell wall biosynthesis
MAGRRAKVPRQQRVLMVLENFAYPQDTRVRPEAETLARAGYAVTVLAPRRRGQPLRERIAGVNVRRFWLPRSSDTVRGFFVEYGVAHAQLLLWALRELARGSDIVHLHNPPDTLFLIGLLARALRRKVVFDQHDSAPELFEEKFGASPLMRVVRAAQRAAIRTATAVIVTNESQKRLALERVKRQPQTLAIVRNGPPAGWLSADVDHRAGRLANPHLVFVGELLQQDGVLDLPGILGHSALSGASLTVVGDGTCREELVRRFAALGIQNRVSLTGEVAHDDVLKLLHGADIAIDPAPCNAYNQISTMMKIAEYLAAGRPVVAYRLTETERTAGVAALYAKCHDVDDFARQIARLAGEPDLRAHVTDAARARAQELVWEHSEERLLELYAGL